MRFFNLFVGVLSSTGPVDVKMPVLSLPLPRIPTGIGEYLPIRVPFPFMRIASILPQAINEPIKYDAVFILLNLNMY